MFSVQSVPPLIVPGPLFALRVRANSRPPRQSTWSKDVKNSAGTATQTYGDLTAHLFDLGGLIGWLRQKFPTSTSYHVEAATGISSASVQNWLDRRSRPSVEHFSILFSVFGPALVRAAVSHPAEWIEWACEAERLAEIDRELLRLAKERDALVK